MKPYINIIILFLCGYVSACAQFDYFNPVPETKGVVKATTKKFPQFATSYFDKDITYYKEGRPVRREAYIDGYLDNTTEYSYFDSETVSSISETSSKSYFDKRLIRYYNAYNEIDSVLLFDSWKMSRLAERQDSFFYNSDGKIIGFTSHTYVPEHHTPKIKAHTIVCKYYCEYDDSLRPNYIESVTEESNAILVQNIYYNDKDKTVLITSEGFALDPEKSINESYLRVRNHLYHLNDKGDWVKSYNINFRGKKELLSKRRIQYK